ncbi:hypothetical protein, partial [Isoptericola sp. NPDC056134]|uniref:hypothetical protein n=1 Tax=Isoptericola sp. NPDC056134 TaxID=3345723 RepID=UPI0035EBEC3D
MGRDGGTDAGRSVVGLAQGSGGAADVGAAVGAGLGAAWAGGADAGADVVPNGEEVPVVANGERRAGPSGRGATVAGGLAAGAAGAALDGAATGGSPYPVAEPAGAAPWSRRVEG